MKPIKLVIVLCSIVGILEIAVPSGGESLLGGMFEISVLEASIYVAIFVLPMVMAIAGLLRPPMLPWQAGVTLASFVLGIVRFRVWQTALHLPSADGHTALRLAVIAIGTAASVVALMRPEAPA